MKGRQQRGTYDSAAELRKIGTSIGDIAGMASNAAKEIDHLRARVAALEADKARLVEALEELHATVQGECPSLLKEDSGGNAALACEIEALLNEVKEDGDDSR